MLLIIYIYNQAAAEMWLLFVMEQKPFKLQLKPRAFFILYSLKIGNDNRK